MCYVATVLYTLASPQINSLAKGFVTLTSCMRKVVHGEVRKLSQCHTAVSRACTGPQVRLNPPCYTHPFSLMLPNLTH